ncbi:hypothetical protein SAMN05216387_107137 [Nitrosovibrio tenuis]|uniref:Uncharacterized protein n=1 Tax=Nitrosovibrio tenuis TaxID=1233 RepID=A0A1H7NTT5_9PROT|nr:hypothetical protein SAMN05216387_107137 [Nitrosovibrio tenuis]
MDSVHRPRSLDEEMFLKVFADLTEQVRGVGYLDQSGSFLEHSLLTEVIMEMAILVIGVGAAALWFFLTKDKPSDKDHSLKP